MKLKGKLFRFILLPLSVLSFGQNELSQTSTIDVYPHWSIGDTHSVKITSTTTEVENKKPLTYLTTYHANFKVVEKTESRYLIEWTYTNVKLAAKDPVIENNIVAKLLNVKFKIKLSNYGKFIDLANAEELRLAANKAIDELIAKEPNSNMKIQYKSAKELIISEQGLETALLKHIKLYNLSFGYTYTTDSEKTNQLKIPNPLGGVPFDAVEKVKLAHVDFKNSICTIETSKIVDGKILSKSVMDFLKRNNKDHIKEIEKEFGNYIFEITEKSMHELNFEKGIVLKSSFQRIMNLGFQNRTIVTEIQAVQ